MPDLEVLHGRETDRVPRALRASYPHKHRFKTSNTIASRWPECKLDLYVILIIVEFYKMSSLKIIRVISC